MGGDDDRIALLLRGTLTPAERAQIIRDLPPALYDQYRQQAVPVHPNPDHPTRVAARQGFTPTSPGQPRLGTPHSRIKDPRELKYVLSRFAGNGVLVFTSGHRYTYAAIYIPVTQRWYITGKGEFYGKNEFEFDEFIDDVLMRDEVTNIWASDRFDPVYGA